MKPCDRNPSVKFGQSTVEFQTTLNLTLTSEAAIDQDQYGFLLLWVGITILLDDGNFMGMRVFQPIFIVSLKNHWVKIDGYFGLLLVQLFRCNFFVMQRFLHIVPAAFPPFSKRSYLSI